MFIKNLYSRVEDIAKAMLSKVLNAYYSINPRKRIMTVQP
jgi:hypothetical protein